MKRFYSVAICGLVAVFVFAACDKELGGTGKSGGHTDPPNPPGSPLIEGLTLENFPVLDGSTSTDPLVNLMAAKLLGYDYKWELRDEQITWEMSTGLPEDFTKQKLLCSQTHGSIVNLIDGGADIIFSARTMSADEKVYAGQKGVTLMETPVALDALIFMGNRFNPVNSLTHGQIEDIYLGRTHNWNEVGGDDLEIVPYVRNKNSGSQELMESLVMSEPIPEGFYESQYEDFQMIPSMIPVFSEVQGEKGGLAYTVYYFKEKIIGDVYTTGIKTLAVNGILPTSETIAARTYPFTAEVYMMVRSDIDPSSIAYKIYEYMQADEGQKIVDESGYVPFA